jgi:tetratricopeptide (TPR) repeat protein
MKKPLWRTLFFAAALAAQATSGWSWGPKAQLSIVVTAARVMSKEGVIPLTNLEKDLRSGVSVSRSELEALIPDATRNPLAAIESEMYLLQAVRSSRIDPYFTYRLGVLGRLVADITAPLAGANSTYRNMYYTDVDEHVDRSSFKGVSRKLVDPPAYFARVIGEARAREDVMLKDYQEGIGFAGVARAALAEDTSRSINAVADVWHTVVQGTVVVANISETQIRDYGIRGLQFYIARQNNPEIDAAYGRLAALDVLTPDLRKQIGDMFYDAQNFERAMAEYRSLLAEAPHRRDVIEKMAAFYVRLGDEALAEEELESARDAYAQALEIDRLHPSAQGKLLQAQSLIAERDKRLAADRGAIESAKEFQNQADQEALQRNYAQAVGLLKEAEDLYRRVSDEFTAESQVARTGLNSVSTHMRELKNELMRNADSFSGSGANLDARRWARESARPLSEQALRDMISAQYGADIEKLRQELRNLYQSPSASP